MPGEFLPSWFFFALAASVLWAMALVIDKYVLTTFVKSVYPSAIISGTAFFLFGLLGTILYPLPPLPAETILAGVAIGCIWMAGNVSYFSGISRGQATVGAAILNSGSLFVLLLAFLFLGERLSIENYAGVFLIVAGAASISLEAGAGFKKILRPGVAAMILTTLLFAAAEVAQKKMLLQNSFSTMFFLASVGAFAVTLLILAFKLPQLQQVVRKNPKAIGFIAASEVITTTGLFSATYAFSQGHVTIVSAVVATSPLFTLLLASAVAYLFPQALKGEETGRKALAKKAAAMLLIIAGTILVAK